MAATDRKAVDEYGRVAVVMGGDSAEREISLLSGNAVLKSLLASGVDAFPLDTGSDAVTALTSSRPERAIIMLHGKNGEDGKIQAVLELMDIPYTGSGVLASALAMDKVRSKQLWLANELETPGFVELDAETDWKGVIRQLGDCFVKPVSEGSSIGIGIARSADELRDAFESARRYGNRVMAEQLIEGAEYSVSILGDRILPTIELRTGNEFYDFNAKYEATDTHYICPCDLDNSLTEQVRQLSKAAYDIVGCQGWGRVDLMGDSDGRFWLLEVNTVPGMTSHSLVPMAAKAAGMEFNELVLEILASSNQDRNG